MVDMQIQEYKDVPTEEKKNLMTSLVELASLRNQLKPVPELEIAWYANTVWTRREHTTLLWKFSFLQY